MTELDLNKWYVRNNEGKMIPFSAFASTEWTFGSPRLERYNGVLFTADGFTGELIECNEGDLQWMDKKEVLALPTWEGDAIFLKLLIEEDEHRFFTLRLVYEGSKLVEKQLYRYS